MHRRHQCAHRVTLLLDVPHQYLRGRRATHPRADRARPRMTELRYRGNSRVVRLAELMPGVQPLGQRIACMLQLLLLRQHVGDRRRRRAMAMRHRRSVPHLLGVLDLGQVRVERGESELCVTRPLRATCRQHRRCGRHRNPHGVPWRRRVRRRDLRADQSAPPPTGATHHRDRGDRNGHSSMSTDRLGNGWCRVRDQSPHRRIHRDTLSGRLLAHGRGTRGRPPCHRW